MTGLQKKFAENYVIDYNASNAYQRATDCTRRTAESEGSRLLKKPEVMEYIKQLQAENVRRFGELSEVIAKELAEDIVFRDENGKHSPSWQRSAELLSKQLGLYTTNLNVESANGFTITILGDKGDE